MVQQLIYNITDKPFVENLEDYSIINFHQYLTDYLKDNHIKIGVENIDTLSNEQFVAVRNNTFGASDAAVLLKSAYSSKKVLMKTTEQLIHEKVTGIYDEKINKLPAVRKGKEQEPWILDKISKRWNIAHIKPKHMYKTDRGTATNFDGVVFMKRVNEDDIIEEFIPIPLEIKSCSLFGRRNYKWELGMSEFSEGGLPRKRVFQPSIKGLPITEHILAMSRFYGIPKYYYVQLQQQMMYLNAPFGYLGVMDDSEWTVVLFRIEADHKVQRAIDQKAFEAYTKMNEIKRENI